MIVFIVAMRFASSVRHIGVEMYAIQRQRFSGQEMSTLKKGFAKIIEKARVTWRQIIFSQGRAFVSL